jgi:hypothetical protein
MAVDICRGRRRAAVTSRLITSSRTPPRRARVTKVWRKSCAVKSNPTRFLVRATRRDTAVYFSGRPSSPPQRLTNT